MNFLSKKTYKSRRNNFKSCAPCSVICALISTLLGLSFSSCTEDIDFSGGITNNLNDDYITVEFFIPDQEKVQTRSNDDESERQINSLTLAIYNAEKTQCLQIAEIENYKTNSVTGSFPNEGNEREFSVTIEKEEPLKKENGPLHIVAVANTKKKEENGEVTDFLDGVGSYNDLMEKTSTVYKLGDKGFFMSGETDVTGSVVPSIILTRSCAKIQVKDETGTDDKFELIGFDIYKTASACYVTAGISNKFWSEYLDGFVDDGNETPEIRYPFPTKTHEGNEIKTYLVIKGKYDSIDCYYAIPLYSQSLKEHFNIEPNHFYEVIIKEVNQKGQVAQDNKSGRRMAIANPCDYIIYEIHDHAPEVLSMVSDGVHELGVKRSVELEEFDENNTTVGYLTVKCYSANGDPFDIGDIKILDIEKNPVEESTFSWFKIDTDNPETLGNVDNSKPGDSDNSGDQVRYKVSLKEARYSEQTDSVFVKWRNLERKVIIHYDPGFAVSEVCDVTLHIYREDGTEAYAIYNYLHFLQPSENPDKNSNYKIFGLDPNAMADGKIRNEGFHFPMPYGTGTPWTYVYDIDFSELERQMKEDGVIASGDGILSIDYTVIQNSQGSQRGVNVLNTTNVKWTPDGSDKKKGKLSFDLKSSYGYAVGKITFQIKYGSEASPKTRNLSLDLYHTGFFHHDESEKYSQGINESDEFLYYEVIQVENMHWLDRNIGARSNKMFVDNNSENGLGNKEARGVFLKISQYTDYQYKSPVIETGMCPPGYHIPNTNEWTSVRLSENFVDARATDENNNNYTTTYYNSGVGKVYFPRAKYWYSTDNNPIKWFEESANNGDASVGYYWTSSEAQGMERNEMGKWVRAVYITGSTSTYQNTDVVTSKMNLRCVADEGKTVVQDNHYISFNVHNATHVYLFDKTTHAPLYTFPGHAIGTEASGNQWQYFSCTVSTDLNSIGALFTKLSTDGTVTLFTKDGSSEYGFAEKSSPFQDKIEEAIGAENYWDIEIGKYYDFCKVRKKTHGQNVLDSNPTIYFDEEGQQYRPDYCNAPEEIGSSSAFKPELEEEEIIWEGESSAGSSWNDAEDITNSVFNWYSLPYGSTVKIYIIDTGGFVFQPRTTNWGNLNENGNQKEYRIAQSHESIKNANIRVINMDLTDEWLNLLRSGNGLKIFGEKFELVGVTIIRGNGEAGKDEDDKLEPENPNEVIILQDNNYITSWNGIAVNYDWSSISAGSTLKVYAYPLNPNSSEWYCVSFRKNIAGWPNLMDNAQWDNPNGSKSITLDQNILDILKSDGLLLTGLNAIVKLVTITP